MKDRRPNGHVANCVLLLDYIIVKTDQAKAIVKEAKKTLKGMAIGYSQISPQSLNEGSASLYWDANESVTDALNNASTAYENVSYYLERLDDIIGVLGISKENDSTRSRIMRIIKGGDLSSDNHNRKISGYRDTIEKINAKIDKLTDEIGTDYSNINRWHVVPVYRIGPAAHNKSDTKLYWGLDTDGSARKCYIKNLSGFCEAHIAMLHSYEVKFKRIDDQIVTLVSRILKMIKSNNHISISNILKGAHLTHPVTESDYWDDYFDEFYDEDYASWDLLEDDEKDEDDEWDDD